MPLVSACKTRAEPSKDQAWGGDLVERRVRLDIEHLLGDRAEGRHEMVSRLHHDERAGTRIDSDIGKELKPQRLRSLADQDDLDATHAHRRAVAERHLGRPKSLPTIAGEADHFD